MDTNEEQALKDHLKASEIGKKVRKYAQEIVQKEKSLLQIAEKIEGKTEELGGSLAFPCNLSLNEQAAHYTPKVGDETQITDKHVLKVDFGVHVNGYVIDQAFTVDYTKENGKLVETAELALQNALSIMRAGKTTRDVGKEIEKTIKGKGFKPIENLCGHSLEQFNLHAGIEVPNVDRGGYEFKEGDAFAVEPFVTTGRGFISEGEFCQIYSMDLEANVPIRLPRSRQLVEEIAKKTMTLPFALRYFKEFEMINLALADLVKKQVLTRYPVLIEPEGSMIAQSESSVLIEKDSVKVLT